MSKNKYIKNIRVELIKEQKEQHMSTSWSEVLTEGQKQEAASF